MSPILRTHTLLFVGMKESVKWSDLCPFLPILRPSPTPTYAFSLSSSPLFHLDTLSLYMCVKLPLILSALFIVSKGLFLRDLTFVEVGNSRYLSEGETKIVNFDRCRMIAAVLTEVQRHQEVWMCGCVRMCFCVLCNECFALHLYVCVCESVRVYECLDVCVVYVGVCRKMLYPRDQP